MSDDAYNAIDALRSTAVKKAGKSLFHYKAYIDGLIEPTNSQQKGWDLGSARHSALLEKNLDNFMVFKGTTAKGEPYANPRASKAFDTTQEENPSKILITEKE